MARLLALPVLAAVDETTRLGLSCLCAVEEEVASVQGGQEEEVAASSLELRVAAAETSMEVGQQVLLAGVGPGVQRDQGVA